MIKRFLLICFTFFNVLTAQNSLPDMVIFLTDDQSRIDASIYGNKHIRTPNLERLAAMGMTFSKAFVASPSCAPSRAALLSGLMPARNGAEANHSYPREGTLLLTTILQEKGYEVAAFGKVAHGKMNQEVGFDYYSRPSVNLAEHVKEYLNKRTSKKPLCLIVGDRRPHVPWTENNTYGEDIPPLPGYFIDTDETREHWQRYYTDISGADMELGMIMDIAQLRLSKNRIILYSSDHGAQWPFGKWNLYDAGINVPLLIAWPGKIKSGSWSKAMLSWVDLFPTLLDMVGAEVPDGLDGRSFKDVLLGKTKKHRAQIFTTHSGDGIYNVYPIRSIRNKRYKYIVNLLPDHYHTNHSDLLRKDGAGAYWDSWDEIAKVDPKAEAVIQKYYARPAEEFYDLKKDPWEQHNLIKDPKHLKRIQQMKADLAAWIENQQDEKEIFNEPYPLDGPKPDKVIIDNIRKN